MDRSEKAALKNLNDYLREEIEDLGLSLRYVSTEMGRTTTYLTNMLTVERLCGMPLTRLRSACDVLLEHGADPEKQEEVLLDYFMPDE